jgi:hypothetical protein
MSASRTKFGIYPSYLFRDHDPVLDQIDTLFDKARAAGLEVSRAKVAKETNVSASTMLNWRKRRTKRPQFATVAAVANYLGGELTISFNGRKLYGTQNNNG